MSGSPLLKGEGSGVRSQNYFAQPFSYGADILPIARRC
jgi:hypothetical protein